MNLIQVLFYVMAFITLASAIFVAASKSLVRSIFMFFITLFALAGLYVLALADFVAITQVVIYVGGILVLILFAFMLSGRETLEALEKQKKQFISANKIAAFFLSGIFFVVLLNMVLKVDADHLPWISSAIKTSNVITPININTDNIGINLMTRYLLPFEAISILLMMALIGAAHLSRKEQTL
ncbi:NADH-quinone oxidoreductase subunit J family protein [Mucilaginibacter sp.]